MIRLLVLIVIIAVFSKPIFRFVYKCIRKLSAFYEGADDLSIKYDNKINAERGFNDEWKQKEKGIEV